MEAAHDLDIQRLEGVASRLDEVDTGVDAVVDNVAAVNLVLSLKVGVETLLNVLDNRAPRVVVVDKVTEARGINDAQAETDTVLLNVGAGGLDRHGLGDDVGIGAGTLLRGVEGGVEQGVDEGRLSETRFTCSGVWCEKCSCTSQLAGNRPEKSVCINVHTDNHDVEVESLADTLAVPLVGQVGETDITSELAADHVLHVVGSLGDGLGVARADSLSITGAHGVGALHERRLLAAAGRGRVVGRDGGTVRNRRS